MKAGNGRPRIPIRVKFGPRPYTQVHVCAYCRDEFERGGFWLRLEQAGVMVDMPICPDCLAEANLFEVVVPFTEPSMSYRVGLA